MLRVSDIWDEVDEAMGGCNPAKRYKAITRAVELLANTGLYDPQLRTVEIAVASGYFLALPRDCKAPIRINLDKKQSFSRSRLYEFTPNTPGTIDGAEQGVQYSDAGRSPIQNLNTSNARAVKYQPLNAADNGKTCTVTGINDTTGLEETVVLIGDATAPTASSITFRQITEVQREESSYDCLLVQAPGQTLARYQPTEVVPDYRIVKLSKTSTTARVLYRRHVFTLDEQTDIIPCDSAMAIIAMARAVKQMWAGNFEEAAAVQEAARALLKEEQASRDDGMTMAASLEVQSATNSSTRCLDQLICADVYDTACDIFGPIGREKILDKITDALRLLSNASQWDWMCGWVDLVRPSAENEIAYTGKTGHGYFVLPRFIGSALAVIADGHNTIPRNRWFEFHLNGTGQSARSDMGTWDDAGPTCLIQEMPRFDKTIEGKQTAGDINPLWFYAVNYDTADDINVVRVYGWYLDDETGQMKRAIDPTDKKDGLLVNRVNIADINLAGPYADYPALVKVDRVTREAGVGEIRFYAVRRLYDENAQVFLPDSDHPILMGQWDADEVEPRYQAIKLQTSKSSKLRIKYRRRQTRIASLFEPLHLQSKVAIENMLRSIMAHGKDPSIAIQYQGLAVAHMSDELARNSPNTIIDSLQFDTSVSVALTENIQ